MASCIFFWGLGRFEFQDASAFPVRVDKQSERTPFSPISFLLKLSMKKNRRLSSDGEDEMGMGKSGSKKVTLLAVPSLVTHKSSMGTD